MRHWKKRIAIIILNYNSSYSKIRQYLKYKLQISNKYYTNLIRKTRFELHSNVTLNFVAM